MEEANQSLISSEKMLLQIFDSSDYQS